MRDHGAASAARLEPRDRILLARERARARAPKRSHYHERAWALRAPARPAPPPPSAPARPPEAQLEHEDRLFRVLGIVGGLGFWEAWRLPMVCRELRFGFSGGGAPADMIRLGLEKRGVWAELRAARAARRGPRGWTRLIGACFVGAEDVRRVCELVELGWPGSVDARDAEGATPLLEASGRGLAATVKMLLAAGADANALSRRGLTPLMAAGARGDASVVSALLAAGARVNAARRSRETPLHSACAHGHLEAARLLVAAGADVNARTRGDYVTPLALSRGRGGGGGGGGRANAAIETLLLAAGASAD